MISATCAPAGEADVGGKALARGVARGGVGGAVASVVGTPYQQLAGGGDGHQAMEVVSVVMV